MSDLGNLPAPFSTHQQCRSSWFSLPPSPRNPLIVENRPNVRGPSHSPTDLTWPVYRNQSVGLFKVGSRYSILSSVGIECICVYFICEFQTTYCVEGLPCVVNDSTPYLFKPWFPHISLPGNEVNSQARITYAVLPTTRSYTLSLCSPSSSRPRPGWSPCTRPLHQNRR